jgi:radical SAM protein with 4Fe4S-binding SPASM domain
MDVIKRIPASYKRKLEKVERFISIHRPRSLEPNLPSTITIDPASTCNLKCPLCPTGLGKLNSGTIFMPFDRFKLIVDRIPSLEHICLFNWGEPFLNPSIFKMIKHANKRKARVTIHSNFSLKKGDDFHRRILESELDNLVVSLDGASQDSYSKYRIGGDLDLVLSNIDTLRKMRDSLGLRDPRIIWKFLVNRFNEREIDEARKMARDLGIEFETAFFGLSDDLPGFDLGDGFEKRKAFWLPANKRLRHPYYRGEYTVPLFNSICTQLFETVTVGPDGKVFPCCWVTDSRHAFGDLTKESLEDIWTNSKYVSSRNLFLKEESSGPKENTVCASCTNFRKLKKY